MITFDQIKVGELYFDGFRIMERVSGDLSDRFNFNALDAICSRFEWVRQDAYVVKFDGNWNEAAVWFENRNQDIM
jgi:hypothetical protein